MLRFAVAVFCFAASAAAQTVQTVQTAQTVQTVQTTPIGPMPSSHHVETTISLGTSAEFTATRIQFNQDHTANSQALDPAAGVLGTIRQSFNPWVGYTVNLGYARTTEVNTGELAGYNSPYFIPSNVYETSLAWHVQNHITPRLTGFFDIGGGVLIFLPIQRGVRPGYLNPSVTFRPLGVSSVGFDYHVTSRLALRAEYRGLLYKYADYGGVVGKSVTLSSAPTLSLVYQFGQTGRKK